MKQWHWLGAVSLAVALSLAFTIPMVEDMHAQGRTSQDYEPPTVFQGAGPTTSSIQGLLDQFRLALGGANNGNAPGPLQSGRREINWDGGGSSATSLVPTPFTGFLTTRGGLFLTPGSGFVQAPVGGIATTFDNADYANDFQPFSPLRLFSPIGSNITEAQFFIPGTGVAAVTNGFGAVFSDVDQPDGSGPGGKRGNRGASTVIQYFGTKGELLFSSWVPASPGDGGFSFLAIMFPDARIASVRIMTGDQAGGPDDTPEVDIVMMDDFIYGEPRAAASANTFRRQSR